MSLQSVQQAFINHIKDPHSYPEVEGIEPRRMAIYRDLFFNNIVGFVSNAFPVLHSLYEQQQWQDLIRQFFIEYDCHSPYFVDISGSFVDYLTEHYQRQPADHPFMVELAHYEWVELEVSIRKVSKPYLRLTPELIQSSALVLSQTAWPLSYTWPVHQISAEQIPSQAVEGGVHLIVYRDQHDDVQFMQINGVTALLLQSLSENAGIQMSQLVDGLTQLLPQFDSQVLQAGAVDMIHKLADKGIICQFSD